jgi:hypothetical protein
MSPLPPVEESVGLIAIVALTCFFWLGAATGVIALARYRRRAPGLPGWLGAFAFSVAGFGMTYWYLGSILASG